MVFCFSAYLFLPCITLALYFTVLRLYGCMYDGVKYYVDFKPEVTNPTEIQNHQTSFQANVIFDSVIHMNARLLISKPQ